jgi:hypothetical protein
MYESSDSKKEYSVSAVGQQFSKVMVAGTLRADPGGGDVVSSGYTEQLPLSKTTISPGMSSIDRKLDKSTG